MSETTGTPAATDALVAGLLALLVYVLLGQQTFYKVDGHLYLAYVLNGERSYPRHFLYLPMVFLARDCLTPFGLSLYEAARLLSAIGAATGIALLHLASRRLGLPRPAALLVTALCATMPSVVFFATVVEVHGPFLMFFGMTACSAAWLANRPTAGRAALLGAACALAFCAHSTAALLPALLLPLSLLYPPRPFRHGLAPGVVVAACLGLGILATPWLARLVHVDFDLRHSSEFATDRARTNFGDAWRYGHTLLYEWLVPMLPLSVLAPVWTLLPRLRTQAAWLCLAAAIYLGVAQMILGGEAEWGAYLLPFCWPLALLAVRALPRTAVLGIVCAQLVLGIVMVERHDDPRATRAYADALRTQAGAAEVALLVGDDLDLQAHLLHLRTSERIPLFELARLPAAALDDARRALQAKVDDLLAHGAAVFLSDRARARVLALPAVTPCGPGLIEWLDQRYHGERIEVAGFAGTRLRP